jgi:hypothetical protein
MLEEFFERGIAHLNLAVLIQDHHGVGIARKKKLQALIGHRRIGILATRLRRPRCAVLLMRLGAHRIVTIFRKRSDFLRHVVSFGARLSRRPLTPCTGIDSGRFCDNGTNVPNTHIPQDLGG